MGYKLRFWVAAFLAAAMGLYAAAFARFALDIGADLTSGFFGIEWLSWAPILGFVVATGAAAIANARLAAVALVFGVLAFFVAHWRHVFDVPLAFLLVSIVTVVILFLMPSDSRRWR